MSKGLFYLSLLFVFLCSISCKTAYQNTLFGEPQINAIKKYKDSIQREYKIQSGDELNIKVYTRKGAAIIESIKPIVISTQDISSGASNITYLVDDYGVVNIPIVGNIKVAGLTESEVKIDLERYFEEDYQDPYVAVSVLNRRAFIFKGTQAGVIVLGRNPMNIFEVIAKSGGLDRHMSTSDIMLVRGELKSPKIFKIDISTFNGIAQSETTIQPNDIIYIAEKKRELYWVMQDIAPTITLPLTIISSLITTVLVIVTLTK